MANKEMKTLTFGDVTYEIVDEKARKELKEKGNPYGIASLDETGKVPKEQLPEMGGENAQSDWNENTETSDAFIKNKPNVKFGSGEKSLVIGDGDAKGKNSIAGGSNDSDEINKVKKMAQLAGYNVDTDNPTSYGDGSLALGVGTKSHSTGSMAIGISNSAGVKGFYWHSIDWSGEKPVIQLSIEQKPYYYYKIPIVGTKVPVNETATWNTDAGNLLANWAVEDALTIVNNIKYGEKAVITAIDSANGRITVESLPFTESDVKTEYASLSDITSLIFAFDDYSIYNPSRVASGVIEFAYGALALGLMTNAAGSFSTALGYNTKVTTDFGHAEGRNTKAGYAAHAEGLQSLAKGLYSHAEGYDTKAIGVSSHAEGRKNQAIGDYAHAEGNESQAIGLGSHSEGTSKANGTYSHAEGYSAEANGSYSHTEGNKSIADGDYSHAEGDASASSGIASHAEGNSIARGDYAHAEGKSQAIGKSSHAEGNGTYASGGYSHAEGNGTYASGGYSHAEGNGTYARGGYSHAEGNDTYADGDGSHSEGGYTKANATFSHAEGYNTQVNGDYGHTEGRQTTADGKYAHAEGNESQAIGLASHSEGSFTKANGNYSHAEGYESISNGLASHSEGSFTKANGNYSHAEGAGTKAKGNNQHVQGKYNVEDTEGKYAHIVGNGTSSTELSNAHTVSWEGQGYFAQGTTMTGADYAEYFEWLDGNPDKEDRVGLIVTLDGEKIRLANTGDEVLGIISGTVAVLGDNYECEWNGKYVTDEFGRVIYDMVEEFSDEIVGEDEEGNLIIEKQSLGFFKHPRINPDYNPEQKYINRADRPEWDSVGMLGKLYVRDDGTCQVNGYATVGENGIATASSEKTNMRVLSRVNENVVRVLLK